MCRKYLNPIPRRRCIWMVIWQPFHRLNFGKFLQQLKNKTQKPHLKSKNECNAIKSIKHQPFKTTTDAIVIQKKISGHPCESTIARPTVTMNTITSITRLNTMRGVRFPLKKNLKQKNKNNSKMIIHLKKKEKRKKAKMFCIVQFLPQIHKNIQPINDEIRNLCR